MGDRTCLDCLRTFLRVVLIIVNVFVVVSRLSESVVDVYSRRKIDSENKIIVPLVCYCYNAQKMV